MMTDENVRNVIARFFNDTCSEIKIAERIKGRYSRYLSADFNVFNYLKFSFGENKISFIISKLLDPMATHGQGDKFLKLFVETVKKSKQNKVDCKWAGSCDTTKRLERINEDDLLKSKVKCESVTKKNRRIDIVININDHFGIGIENKPYSEEQPVQIPDYCEELSSRFGKDNFVLIFLAPSYKTPETCKYVTRMNYTVGPASLTGWLIECYKECDSEKVRFFIKDFVAQLESRFKIKEKYEQYAAE